MKLKISLLSCFVLLMFSVVFAQTTPDTIPYRITQYELKKTQKVSAVAKSLKVDPATIVKLNKLKSTEQELPKGRRLKVPQYGKGVVYIPPSERKPEKEVVKKESAPKAKSKEKSKPETVIIIEDKPRVPVEKSTTTKPEKQKAPAKKEEDKQPKEKKAAEKKPADKNITGLAEPAAEKPATTKPGKEKTTTKKAEDKKPKEDNTTEKKPAADKQVRAKQKPEDKPADKNISELAKEAEKEKAAALEQARENLRRDSLKMAQQKQAAAALRAKEGIRANYDPEIDQNNLMLVDATLELNEAMLAGVKASLDTLNSPDPPIKNNNDVKEILQRMKRQRDKQQLKPYLEYMNDSLSLDCAKLRTQREDILSRLTPYLDYQQKMEALANKPVEDAPVASATVKNPKKKEKEAKKPVTDNAVVIRDTALALPQPTVASAKKAGKEKGKDKGVKATSSIDTVIVYDVSKPVAAKPAKEKNIKPVTAKKDMAERLKPVVASAKEIRDTIIVEDAQKPEPAKDTVTVAKETSKQVEKPAKNTAAAKTDTVTTAKNKDKKPAKPEPVVTKKDTVKKTETVVIDSRPKVDTVAKTVVAKADVKPTVKPAEQTTATATAAGADTIQNIKSQFFLRRAQKAIAEKKSKLAEEYLLKSIELWRDNYDAWMALADEYTKAESPVKALEAYQQCMRIDPMQPKLYYKIGSLHLTSKKKTEALQNFTKAISIDSTFLLAYMSRASVYGDYKQYDAAIADYNKVLNFNKSYYIAYRERGMVKQLSRNFSEAVDDFTRYLIFDDMDPSAYYYRGLAKIGNKELLEGCLDLSKAAEMGYDAAEKAIKKSCE